MEEFLKLVARVPGISLRGEDIKVGAEFETTAHSGQALLAEGAAVLAEAVEATNKQDAPESQPGALDDEEEKARLRKALDDRYNLDEGGQKPGLKKVAQEIGVEFAVNASKAEIIDAIIDQGKATELVQ